MLRLHLTKKGQTTFPKQLCDWLGVKPGGDVMIELEKGGRVLLKLAENGAGSLAQYAKPQNRRRDRKAIGDYLGKLDEKTHRRHS